MLIKLLFDCPLFEVKTDLLLPKIACASEKARNLLKRTISHFESVII